MHLVLVPAELMDHKLIDGYSEGISAGRKHEKWDLRDELVQKFCILNNEL